MGIKRTYTENEIVQGCLRNERKFQELLYRSFFDDMCRMCYRYTQDSDDIMTIVNNGFLRVFKKLHLYQFKGSLGGWIRKLVFHSLSDYFRSKNKDIRFLILENNDKSLQGSALEKLFFEDLLAMTEHLQGNTYKVFHLFAIEGYSHKEISEQLKISVGTSKWHLNSARKKLQSLITKQTSHAG